MQTCYFAHKKRDRLFNRFTVTNLNPDRCELIFKIQTSTQNTIKERHLSHDELVTTTTKVENGEPDNNDDDRNNTKRKNRVINEIIKNNVIEMEQIPERDHDFFYRDDANKSAMAKHFKRRIKPYTSTRIKARNLLSNISYSGVKNEDFVDNNFVFDVTTLLTKNI